MMNRLTALFLALPLLASAAVKTDLLVSTAWLADHLKDANVRVIYVAAARTSFDANHIPGAQFLALSELAITKNGVSNEMPEVSDLQAMFQKLGVSDNTKVVVYTEGSVLPATRAFFTLDYLGHDNTALLDGGMEQWTKENRLVTKEVATVAAGKLTPKVRPQLIVSTADVQKQVAAPAANTTLLDVRTTKDFSEGGHIPTALNANWGDTLVTGSSVLKSEDALRRLYATAGVDPKKTVVTYCNSGMQATEAYFTLKYLGYDVKMYDGSLGEWNKTPGTTLAK